MCTAMAPGGSIEQQEFVGKMEYVARDQMNRYMREKFGGHVGDIRVYEKLDPKEEAQKNSGHAAAFNEFWQDVPILGRM